MGVDCEGWLLRAVAGGECGAAKQGRGKIRNKATLGKVLPFWKGCHIRESAQLKQ